MPKANTQTSNIMNFCRALWITMIAALSHKCVSEPKVWDSSGELPGAIFMRRAFLKTTETAVLRGRQKKFSSILLSEPEEPDHNEGSRKRRPLWFPRCQPHWEHWEDSSNMTGMRLASRACQGWGSSAVQSHRPQPSS